VGLIPLLLTPLLAWAVQRRSKSGKIVNTEAEVLWAEANRMREIYREEAESLRKELVDMRATALTIRAEAAALKVEAGAMRDEMNEQRISLAECRATVRRLRRELAAEKEKHRRRN
jgi:hypothetical protein